jgi:hypothetical protein
MRPDEPALRRRPEERRDLPALLLGHWVKVSALLDAAGRDVESQVLSRAVRWHAETRILLNDNWTGRLPLGPQSSVFPTKTK